MSTIKEKAIKTIADISALLFGTEQKFMDAKLSDGTAIKIDGEEIKEGAAVTDAEGNAVADGDYTLEDGTMITCAEGKITAVKAPEVVTTEAKNDADIMKAASEKFGTGTPEERIANLETCVKPVMEYCFGWQIREAENKAATEKAIEVYTTQMNAQSKELAEVKEANKKLTEAFAAILPIVQELANSPAVEPTGPMKTAFNTSKPDPNEKINQIAEVIQNYKKTKN